MTDGTDKLTSEIADRMLRDAWNGFGPSKPLEDPATALHDAQAEEVERAQREMITRAREAYNDGLYRFGNMGGQEQDCAMQYALRAIGVIK